MFKWSYDQSDAFIAGIYVSRFLAQNSISDTLRDVFGPKKAQIGQKCQVNELICLKFA